MNKLLWLDDLRNPFIDKENKVPKGEWVIYWVLNYEQFVYWIERNGIPDAVSFDHDLHPEHYTPEEYWDDYDASKEYQDKQVYTKKTGLDCAKYLTKFCIDSNRLLPTYYVHSANPVGRDYILQELKSNL